MRTKALTIAKKMLPQAQALVEELGFENHKQGTSEWCITNSASTVVANLRDLIRMLERA